MEGWFNPYFNPRDAFKPEFEAEVKKRRAHRCPTCRIKIRKDWTSCAVCCFLDVLNRAKW